MLSKFFRSKSKDADDRPHLPDGVTQSILSYLGMKSIPVMPRAAQQAFQLATNPNSEAEDYVSIVEKDEGLSAKVLKVANSVYYDRGAGSKTIADAINVIGLTELKGLFNATALSNFFPSRHVLRAQFWAHDVAVAITSRVLARAINPSLTDQVFLGGLMHDIGKLLIVQQHTTHYERVVLHGYSEGLESTDAEVLEYPFDHTQVGHLIAERWNFSADLTTVISRHHKPWKDLPSGSTTAIVKAGNIIAHSLALGAGREANQARRIYEPMLAAAWEHLKVASENLQKEILLSAAETFEQERSLYESWSRG